MDWLNLVPKNSHQRALWLSQKSQKAPSRTGRVAGMVNMMRTTVSKKPDKPVAVWKTHQTMLRSTLVETYTSRK
eukprot:scaffold2886_cov398-Prasinococcus_capsulatus_cf.AAC.10